MQYKNIQVIDSANNCAYDIFAANEQDFKLIFPGEGQDIEFAEDFIARSGEDVAAEVLNRLWRHRVQKKEVSGLHGTLFFELQIKKKFYPTKRDAEAIANP